MVNKKSFIKVLALVMCLVSVIALTSCGSNSPKGVVKEEIKSLKESGTDTTTLEDAGINLNESVLMKYTKFLTKVQDFDYDITDVLESGDTAKVTVKVTTYSFGNEYLSVYQKLLENNDDPDNISQNKLYGQLFGAMNKLTDKDYTTSVVIKCTKDDDGKWSSDLSSNSDFQNAIFGDMIQVMKDMSNSDN